MSSGFQTYTYEGLPIEDIHEWAAKRGENIIRYRATRQAVDPFTRTTFLEVQEGEMPETFWKTLCLADGWIYQEIRKEGENK